MENGKITDEKIVKLLLDRGELTVADLGKLLLIQDKAPLITYHLTGLVERKIVLTHKKKTVSTYQLNDKYIIPPYLTMFVFIVSSIFLGSGVYALTVNDNVSIVLLLVSSFIGASTSFYSIISKRKEKTKILFELVSDK